MRLSNIRANMNVSTVGRFNIEFPYLLAISQSGDGSVQSHCTTLSEVSYKVCAENTVT